ncbi:replication initiator [Mycobacterium sp.]|uniref:replication initiator n=1 Tax=Mycobacterium sp. TaxID=1785 RepID=UPI00126AC524|nr:replication initiator [Mycobacterium sp.]KAA8958641.1 MAG: plasmid replication initiator protein [Mycobacterium sp.]
MGTGIDSGDMAAAGSWDDAVVSQAVARASSPGFQAWWSRVAGSGFCARPVHLLGVGRDGGLLRVLGRCKNRRAAVCPSCSQLYGADTWQLIHAGIAGGHHGIPEAVAGHPTVFVTLTAPSFGPVHTIGDGATGQARKCHPSNGFHRCRHGRPLWCGAIHDAADARVGEPLCGDCYDYSGHVLFTWWAPELWRRFTIALRRHVSSVIRDAGGDPYRVRVSFVKVVEFQRRAVPNFHAVIRLDGPPADDGQPTPPPAHAGIDAGRLAGLVHQVAAQVSVAVPAPNASSVTVRFGAQTDAQPITPAGEMGETTRATAGLDDSDKTAAGVGRSPRRVAAYLAKYVCTSVAEFGLAPQRISPLAIEALDVREHIRAILSTLRHLASLPGYGPMVRWLHTLGYRGHVTSKSRRFSTTLAALRARRAAWHQQHTHAAELARSCPDVPDDNRVIGWRLQHIGYGSDGDRMLAVSAAVRAREHRLIARVEYADLIAADNDWAAA